MTRLVSLLLACAALLGGCSQATGGSVDGAAETAGPLSDAALLELYRRDRAAALARPLACPQDRRSVFAYDQGAPPAHATAEDALAGDAARAHVVAVSPTELLALVGGHSGSDQVLVLRRWDNGGWAVDGGSRCRA